MDTQYKALIADDEPGALDIMENLLTVYPEIPG
jgi:hypothetical protein